MKNILAAIALSCVALLTGCAVVVTPNANTGITVENDLTAVSIPINGTTRTLDYVDLFGVRIGDVSFSSVLGGDVTAEKTTSRSGTVVVSVDSAIGVVGGNDVYVFTGFAASSATLVSGEANTVTFGPSFLSGATVRALTKVKVENDLTDLSVDVGGVTTTVSAIDLVGIVIGDVIFDFVAGGTMSSAVSTWRSGSVAISIDSVYVHYTGPFGTQLVEGFASTASMQTTITPGTTNIVVFDETTAGSLLNALAKRQSKQ